MKIAFWFLLLIFSINAPAQASRIFYSQLMVVFSDIGNHFEYLKGDLSGVQGTDTLYETSYHLEGTKENNILISHDFLAYQAMISDSVSMAGSEYILKAWNQKLTEALSDSYAQLSKEFRSQNDPSIDGYLYSSDKIELLLLRHKSSKDMCWINLVIKPK